MAKSKEQKKQIVESLINKIEKSKSVVFAKFSGLQVKENEELRKELKKENSEYYVAKKTLLDLAFRKFEVENLNVKSLEGQLATIFGYKDEVVPAKIVDKFAKNKEGKIEFLGGVLENKFISAEEVKNLAKLPSKLELYAKIVGSLNAPINGFVNVLAGNLRSLVYVLKAIEEKKQTN